MSPTSLIGSLINISELSCTRSPSHSYLFLFRFCLIFWRNTPMVYKMWADNCMNINNIYTRKKKKKRWNLALMEVIILEDGSSVPRCPAAPANPRCSRLAQAIGMLVNIAHTPLLTIPSATLTQVITLVTRERSVNGSVLGLKESLWRAKGMWYDTKGTSIQSTFALSHSADAWVLSRTRYR